MTVLVAAPPSVMFVLQLSDALLHRLRLGSDRHTLEPTGESIAF